jgi:hypothetical protein
VLGSARFIRHYYWFILHKASDMLVNLFPRT